MRCPSKLELSGYFDGEHSPQESHGIKEHVADCPACQAHLNALSHQSRRLALDEIDPKETALPVDPLQLRLGHLRMQRYQRFRGLSLSWPAAAGVAAVFLLTLSLNIFLLLRRPAPVLPLAVLSAGPAGEVQEIPPEGIEALILFLEDWDSLDEVSPDLPDQVALEWVGDPQVIRPMNVGMTP